MGDEKYQQGEESDTFKDDEDNRPATSQSQQQRRQQQQQQQQQKPKSVQNKSSSKPKRRYQPPCNCRIDELARPRRWLILSTWKEHGGHFEPGRSQALREKVQEEFFMTPEETAAYLAQLRQHQHKSRNNDRIRKAELRKEVKAAKIAADSFLQKRIKRGLIYAYQNAPPLLMSPMLRSVSDRVLEELCALHDVSVPKRTDTDKHARYLLSVADWTAILTANIYYEVNVKEKADIDRMMEADRCSYIESEDEHDAQDQKNAVQGAAKVKKEKDAYGKDNKPAKGSEFSERQTGVTNYDGQVKKESSVKNESIREEPVDEAFDEEPYGDNPYVDDPGPAYEEDG